jgi:prepilin-type N-terminal cleavage/methylation domain-containing protein
MKRHMKHQVSAFLFLLGKSLRFQSRTSKSGFTLIESLVAIIVVSVTVVAISPPIFWATATRVQNRRAQQALLVAQGAIEEVRAKVERGSYELDELPSIAPPKVATGIRPYPPAGPTAEWTVARRCTHQDPTKQALLNTSSKLSSKVPNYPSITQYLRVDTDGDDACNPEFLVQIFRNEGICATGSCADPLLTPEQRKPVAFSVGVRVYSSVALTSGVPMAPDKASLIGTTGTGQTGFRPLAVLYATVAKSDSSNALNRYRDLCKAGSTGNGVCE